MNSRPDGIQEPEENKNIKIMIEELEAVPLFEQWPDRRIHIRARLNPEMRATGETPFLLVYGSEALIPVEIGEPNTRFILATEESNDEELRTNLDLLEQRREAALIRMAAQKQIIERYYNRKAHLRYFKIGDFVLKKVFQSMKTIGSGKLNPNWEGPYKVRGIDGKGAYELETMDGKVLPSSWNAVHLKRYYF
nr:uncharacterized protein LOC117281415 [Nicotiana tomentosiformis]